MVWLRTKGLGPGFSSVGSSPKDSTNSAYSLAASASSFCNHVHAQHCTIQQVEIAATQTDMAQHSKSHLLPLLFLLLVLLYPTTQSS